MKARIFDIQRASFVDGPGIRTTVFFQGCNLRCVWCHNPESQSMEGKLMLFEGRCCHCGLCHSACPVGAIGINGEHQRALCIHCGACALVCPQDARQFSAREIDVEVLAKKLLRDKNFYESSHGGTTFSGGECMLQIDALAELLHILHGQGIHTAIDTAGCVPWKYFERILPDTDCFLYDIKCVDPALHHALTGQSNELILANYEKLLSTNKQIIVRVPVIPAYNDVGLEMEHVAAYLRQHSPEQVEFLPYHRLGEGKAEALGRAKFTAEVPSAQRITFLKQLYTEEEL